MKIVLRLGRNLTVFIHFNHLAYWRSGTTVPSGLHARLCHAFLVVISANDTLNVIQNVHKIKVDFNYPCRHWHRWFCFTAKVQMLDDNCNHNGHNAYANEKQEIHNCNMQNKHKHINVCIFGILFLCFKSNHLGLSFEQAYCFV